MAVDYYLKIDGIEGESTDSKLKDQIQVLSWSWGETNTGTASHGTGMGAGKVSMQDFSFTMTVNKASPKLLLACAVGEHIKTALLTCRKAGTDQQEYLKIKFTELLISSYQIGGSMGADSLPVDHVSFNYAKIEVEYAPQKTADGTLAGPVKVGYNLKELKKV